MLPSLSICQQRIKVHNYGSYDKFWRYKLNVERGSGSILDDLHLEETVSRLVENLLLRDEWQLWWTGIASLEKIAGILRKNRNDYHTIKSINLGDGQIAYKHISDAVSRIYAGLRGSEYGITHNNYNNDSPQNGNYFVLGRSKILMFIWGQTPGFDVKVRSRLRRDGLKSSSLWTDKNRWAPEVFCSTLKELDDWIRKWEILEKQSFKSLSKYNRPVGRIIDQIYWY